ncbi:MAG: YhfC family intramembrane metalloprotease [Lachnospiraceae bacterium]|nr:YhfC family intramembrane metalloprotease [Lachnospiraceae bacterium]
MVPSLSVILMAVNILIAFALPIGAVVFMKKKYHVNLQPLAMGLCAMYLFAFVLEAFVNRIVAISPLGSVLTGNMLLYVIYGGIMAAVFEEFGRFITMRKFMKRFHDDRINSITYGIGHGGFEFVMILGIGMIENFYFAYMINADKIGELTAGLEGIQVETINQAVEQLKTVSPLTFLASPVERIAAFILQIALSVLVWHGVINPGKIKYFCIALFAHFFMDCVPVYINLQGAPIWLTESLIWVIALAVAAYTYLQVWKKETPENANTVNQIN